MSNVTLKSLRKAMKQCCNSKTGSLAECDMLFPVKNNLLFFFFFNFILFIYFIQQILIRHQLYTHQCIHVKPNRPIHHTTTTTTTPRLSPLGVHTFVLYICVSISPQKLVHLYHFSRFHINALIYDFCFSLSDLLCMTVSRSIHVSTNDSISFLFMAE